MEIPVDKLNIIEKDYDEFKKSAHYEERKKQLEFSNFAKSLIETVVQKKQITNKDLTAFIQIFGYGSKHNNVKKYISSLNLEESFSTDIFDKFVESGQTGFTGIGKAAIKGLTSNQLKVVHTFLKKILESNPKDKIKIIVSEFEKSSIPQVTYGIYSPWLYYIHPDICPIVVGPVKQYLKELGWNGKNYLDAWNMLEQINQAINVQDYGFFDAFIYDNSNKSNYWLFIVPKSYEDGNLWDYCKEHSLAAMQYQKGSESDHSVTVNINQIEKIQVEDKVIVYLNDNTIGGIGRVAKSFYENTSNDNGFGGSFGQRIDIEWLTDKFEVGFKDLKTSLKKFPKNLSFKTIHEIDREDFDKIFKFVDKGIIEDKMALIDELSLSSEINLLLKKKQIILYGPPGTGKTYNTKEQSVRITVLGSGISESLNRDEINQQYDDIKKKEQIEFVTFHPSYSYEEFVEGITIDVDPSGKPSEQLNYKLKQGIFKQMVIRALGASIDTDVTTDSLGTILQKYREEISSFVNEYETQKEKAEAIKDWWNDKPRFVLIIDEINRGDMSKIFGELITLLEADKRIGMENELTVKLPYSQEEFVIPPNLYVIGTMNTADKSIALIDVALRRRFGFIEMSPNLEILRNEYINKNKEILEDEGVLDGLELSIKSLEFINQRIANDPSVGRDKQIGHSFLFKVQTKNDLILVWKNEILPLLEEYYYGQYSKINELLFNSASDSKWLNKTNGISDFETYESLIDFLGKVHKVDKNE